MHSKLLVLLIAVFSSTPAPGQSKPPIQKKKKINLEWQLNPALGVYLPLTKLLKGQTTDYLIGYDDKTNYGQLLSGNVFFDEHWGIALCYRGSNSSGLSHRKDKFTRDVHNEYDAQYFVEPSTSANMDIEGRFNLPGVVMRGHVGVIYRMQKGRFFVNPQLSVGVTSWYTNYGRAYLKEINTNQYAELIYQDREKPSDSFTPSASVTGGYKITRWLAVNVEVMVSYFRPNIVFNKVVRDLNTKGILSSQSFNYRKNIFTLATGIGLTFYLRELHAKR